jgi:biopolymer transport protein ExbB
MTIAMLPDFLNVESAIMGMLQLTSICALAFIIERGIALGWRRVVPSAIELAVEKCQSMEDLPKLKQICQQNPSSLSRLILVAADHLDWPKEENVDIIQTRARHEVNRLERGLIVLEICTGVAPLMGLVGTIYGMITLFGSLGTSGLGDYAAFASGISLALHATMFGLLIAIPSLISWSYYTRKVESLTIELENLCDAFVRRFYRLQKKEAPAQASAARQQKAPASSTYSEAIKTARPAGDARRSSRSK